MIQQKLVRLTVKHLRDAIDILNDIVHLRPCVVFRRSEMVRCNSVCTLSDASYGGNNMVYGKTVIISGIRFYGKSTEQAFIHPIVCSSHKQRRISYSSFGANILPAASSDDREYDIKMSIRSIFSESPLSHKFLVDSKSLLETTTTLHQGDEYRIRGTVSRMCE